jgi:LysM repeat protein
MYAPPIPLVATRTFIHTVKLGETLPSIAQRYRVSVEDLRQWNKDKVGRLSVGQKLTIQMRGGSAHKSRGSAKGKPRQASPPKPVKRS